MPEGQEIGAIEGVIEGSGEVAVDGRGRQAGVAEVDDAVLGPRQLAAQVAHRGCLAGAWLPGQEAEAGLDLPVTALTGQTS